MPQPSIQRNAPGAPLVLLFDYWTRGIQNFTRLLATPRACEAEFHLLLLESLRQPGVRPFRVVEGIPCTDISAFPGKSLGQVLAEISPSVVVALNMSTLLDRTLYMSCHRLGIPVVYMQHGTMLEGDEFRKACEEFDRTWKVRDYLARVPKYFRAIPWYAEARGGWLDARFWDVLISTARKPKLSHFFPAQPQELWPTLALVFNRADADALERNHRLPPARIRIVGNPELDAAYARLARPLPPGERDRAIRAIGLDPAQPVVFAPDEGLAANQVYGWNAEIGDQRLRELHGLCRQAGAQLLYRPRADGKTVLDGLPGAAATRAISLLDSIDASVAAVGTMSTVLETAVVLRKPILAPTWYVQDRVEASPYLQYNAAVPARDAAALLAAIRSAIGGRITTDTSAYAARRMAAPGSASARIVDELLRLANAAPSEAAHVVRA